MQQAFDWVEVDAAIWRHNGGYLKPVRTVDPIGIDDLLGVDDQKQQLLTNTEQFVRGEPANNALLWGARGTGKSSLIKAVFNQYKADGLRLIQVDKEGLRDLPEIGDALEEEPYKFLIFCDDLSFDEGESGLRELKSLLEGSIEPPPDNIRVYATSNRRHLVPEYMSDNLASRVQGDYVHLADAIEEKISLSDRFGLWLSFYSISQDDYLAIVEYLFREVKVEQETLHFDAKLFAHTKGVRSGRVARQFYNAMWSTYTK